MDYIPAPPHPTFSYYLRIANKTKKNTKKKRDREKREEKKRERKKRKILPDCCCIVFGSSVSGRQQSFNDRLRSNYILSTV